MRKLLSRIVDIHPITAFMLFGAVAWFWVAVRDRHYVYLAGGIAAMLIAYKVESTIRHQSGASR